MRPVGAAMRAHMRLTRAHVRSAGARRHEPARRLAHFSLAYEPTASKACSQRCASACVPGSLRKRVHSSGTRRIIRWRHLQEFVALGKACAEGLHAGAPWAASSARSHGPPRHAMHSCPSRRVHSSRTGARAREALLGGASPAARPAAGRRGCTCERASASRACAATRALHVLALRRVRCVSAGVHIPLLALLRQRRRVRNRRNRRYARRRACE